MAVITITLPDRGMYNLSEQSRVTGTVLGMAVGAPVFDRVTLMSINKFFTFDFMAGSAEFLAFHVQQSRIVCHVRSMTGEAAVIHRFMHSGPGKGF